MSRISLKTNTSNPSSFVIVFQLFSSKLDWIEVNFESKRISILERIIRCLFRNLVNKKRYPYTILYIEILVM